jgi:hypothetical protein
VATLLPRVSTLFSKEEVILADAVPRPQFRKKKTHGLADARGLGGTKIAANTLKEREALARMRDVIIPVPISAGTINRTSGVR